MGTQPSSHTNLPPFEHDFFRSQARFSELVEGKGGALSQLVVPTPLNGRELAIDIALFGRPEAPNKIIAIAGTHGVESPVGAAIHSTLLRQLGPLPTNLAVVFVHSLNPWGFAMARRANGSNVDLNRNSVLIDSERTGAPEKYDDVRDLICPPRCPRFPTFLLRAAVKILRHGFAPLKQAITGGQYVDPKGLFYGGNIWQPELQLLRTYLTEALSHTKRVTAIDTHSGLGEFGTDKVLLDEVEGSTAFLRASSIFGVDAVQGPDPARSITSETKGSLGHLVADCFPGAIVNYFCHEFGTHNPLKMLYALVRENCEFFQEQALEGSSGGLSDNAQRRQILQDAFCPNDKRWRDTVVVPRGSEVFRRVMADLA